MLLGGLIGLSAHASATADIVHVPDDFASIQAAIDAATDGDEIIVAPGTYNETINFLGKAITLRSSAGPNATTIDGTGFYESVVQTWSGGPDTLLSGFTIRDGYAPSGGGMYISADSSPTVVNCIFTGNVADFSFDSYGGGIYNEGGSPTVINCTFTGNSARHGGGMANLGGTPIIIHCTFTGNSTIVGSGGGMFNFGGSPIVIGSTFSLNTAAVDRGAASGGWIRGDGDRITDAHRNLSSISVTYGMGGGMFNLLANPTVVNSMFVGNIANTLGGGMLNSSLDNTTVINCTFAGNSAEMGGGIYNTGSASTLTVLNSILWGNGPEEIADPVDLTTVRYSDIESGWLGAGSDNIDAEPLFVDVDGDDGILGTEDDNLRLQPKSPCIDAGDNSGVPADIKSDLGGHPRIIDGDDNGEAVVDMGAYEFQVVDPCPADLDGDGEVRVPDLIILLGVWGPNPGHPADLDGNGEVRVPDLIILLGAWGACP